ncbi:MAG: hypothetical protein ABIR37_04405 [Candidatus Saccharimonadales bacterium]
MADAKPRKAAPKLFDVAKPGKSAPSSTSRPVIITNRPVLKDPMVIKVNTGEEEAPSTDAATPTAEMKHTVDIKPLHIDLSEVLPSGAPDIKKDDKKADDTPEEVAPADETPAEAEAAPEESSNEKVTVKTEASAPAKEDTSGDETKVSGETEAPEEPTILPSEKPAKTTGEKVIAPPASEKQDAPEPEAKPKETEAAPEKPSAEADSFTSLEDEPSLDNNDRPVLSEKEAKATEEAKKKAEAQEKIITSGEYYLPINAVEKRRAKRNMIVGTLLVVLLLVVAVLAAWDIGVFSIPGFQAPTNFL